MKKIVYPTDGSPTAKDALRIVADLAKEERSEVIVVGVVPVVEIEGVKDAEMGDFIEDAFQGFVSFLSHSGDRQCYIVVFDCMLSKQAVI
ncbi:MAG: hypothetical protein COW32_07745 [Candidatus Aquicultor secundus]|uniref:UspA domain-containing protein n=1 Tax=Candidatus Aquicultor secundus TaxID=1973895 RepID=A0A2M7T6I4_9ACTN|nr:universal stress protein [Candidatus Aquicultor secundus]NCO66908.1 universal stress protein [Solirubrobacter sp.]OIO88519.1 MAG: hypothetical protein AUK32_01405 [Candidatus Aquicultor secundus]PIU27457.1 MAG: hypothetical protein COT10_03380 [Candidatus Aquicultor secundus]PIW21843.1 MAG: hypothetical protein COW32_07745 [Candidatus Aquicultor secundus]PIX52177.1 MAG: hypothetical protein COZ51_05515 [Candidatus Aquicultor secundus]